MLKQMFMQLMFYNQGSNIYTVLGIKFSSIKEEVNIYNIVLIRHRNKFNQFQFLWQIVTRIHLQNQL